MDDATNVRFWRVYVKHIFMTIEIVRLTSAANEVWLLWLLRLRQTKLDVIRHLSGPCHSESPTFCRRRIETEDL